MGDADTSDNSAGQDGQTWEDQLVLDPAKEAQGTKQSPSNNRRMLAALLEQLFQANTHVTAMCEEQHKARRLQKFGQGACT